MDNDSIIIGENYGDFRSKAIPVPLCNLIGISMRCTWDSIWVRRECFVFGIRMLQGVNQTDFQRRTGYNLWKLCGEQIQQDMRQGFIESHEYKSGEMTYRLSPKGLYLSDGLWPKYL